MALDWRKREVRNHLIIAAYRDLDGSVEQLNEVLNTIPHTRAGLAYILKAGGIELKKGPRQKKDKIRRLEANEAC